MVIVTAALLVALLAGGGGAVAWRLRRYPGGWAYAFGGAFAPERRELAAARQAVRRLERAAGRELAAARAGLRGAERRHRHEVATAARRVARLSDPGRGELLLRMGALALHQHAVVVGPEELPLAGLVVRFEKAGPQYVLHFALPNGRVRRQPLDPALHTGEEVRGFGNRVAEAVAQEQLLLKRRDQLVAGAQAELRRLEQRTAPQSSARDRLAEVAAHQQADRRPAEARQALTEALARWRALRGRQ